MAIHRLRAHFLQLLLRFVLTFIIALTLPLSHDVFGMPYPGDGQKSFGVLLMLAVYGAGIAIVYLVLGCLGQFFLRRRRFRISLLLDLAGFCLITLVLAISGATIRYSDDETLEPSLSAFSAGCLGVLL